MRAIRKVKLKLFMLDLTFELIVNLSIFAIAWINNKIIETLFFYLSWNAFRYAFPKIFHIKAKTPLISIIGCAICSIFCFYLAIKLSFPVNISIFSGVILGGWMNYVLYLLADYRDLRLERKKQTIDIYNMNEEELRAYAQSKCLSEMIVDTLILRVIHNYRWCEIAKERNYTKEGIRYHKERIQKQLNIKL